MNVSVTPEFEEFVNEKVQSGRYNSASDVISEGLRLLKEKDDLNKARHDSLREDIQKGLDSLREGRFTVYDSPEDLANEIKAEGLKRLLAEKQKGK